jgi:hypothetical protein
VLLSGYINLLKGISMAKGINWQLLTIEEMVALIKSFGSDTGQLRARKAYYKRTDNTIMTSRITAALDIINSQTHLGI